MFVLTDGQVDNRDAVVSAVSTEAKKSNLQLYTFGTENYCEL